MEAGGDLLKLLLQQGTADGEDSQGEGESPGEEGAGEGAGSPARLSLSRDSDPNSSDPSGHVREQLRDAEVRPGPVGTLWNLRRWGLGRFVVRGARVLLRTGREEP